MKIALTGHTGKVGSIITNGFKNVVGFSRSNGFDVRTDRKKIVDLVKDNDVFINCAHAGPGFAQTELFWDVFRIWKDDPTKVIINIGSDRADISLWNLVSIQYRSEKAALISATQSAQQEKHQCKVSIINPNVVTEMMHNDLINIIQLCIDSKSEIKSVNLQ